MFATAMTGLRGLMLLSISPNTHNNNHTAIMAAPSLSTAVRALGPNASLIDLPLDTQTLDVVRRRLWHKFSYEQFLYYNTMTVGVNEGEAVATTHIQVRVSALGIVVVPLLYSYLMTENAFHVGLCVVG
jgi:hypothetical protein